MAAASLRASRTSTRNTAGSSLARQDLRIQDPSGTPKPTHFLPYNYILKSHIQGLSTQTPVSLAALCLITAFLTQQRAYRSPLFRRLA